MKKIDQQVEMAMTVSLCGLLTGQGRNLDAPVISPDLLSLLKKLPYDAFVRAMMGYVVKQRLILGVILSKWPFVYCGENIQIQTTYFGQFG